MPVLASTKVGRRYRTTVPREVARFIQSRFGELSISEARYEDLLAEADQYYPSYLELLKREVYGAT